MDSLMAAGEWLKRIFGEQVVDIFNSEKCPKTLAYKIAPATTRFVGAIFCEVDMTTAKATTLGKLSHFKEEFMDSSIVGKILKIVGVILLGIMAAYFTPVVLKAALYLFLADIVINLFDKGLTHELARCEWAQQASVVDRTALSDSHLGKEEGIDE